MKLALECRTDLLEMIQPFADFDFILARHVLEDEQYAAYYKESSRLKVLDNGVNEEDEPLSMKELKEAFAKINANFVVSPDWINDSVKTIGAYPECVKVFGEDKVIGVLQGRTPIEALSCLQVYKGHTVAVPYRVGGSDLTTYPEVEALKRALVVAHIPAEKFVHLFGFTTLGELLWYENRPNVLSIDTGIPVLLGLLGKDILDPMEPKEIPTNEAAKKIELTQTGWTAIIRNIALLRKYL